jgi:hypothetical protein
MNHATFQSNRLPNKYGMHYIIHKPAHQHLFEIFANLIKTISGMISAVLKFNLRKEKHVHNEFKMGESTFVRPMDIQQAFKYIVIIYIVVAVVTMPSGICSSSYQAQNYNFPLLSAHKASDYLNGLDELEILPEPVSIAQGNGEEQPTRAEDSSTPPPPFHGHILQASKAYEVDIALIRAIIMAESSNNPRAVSHQGAKGLMQLMPTTAKSLGVEDAFDPAGNIDGGVRYFKQLLDRFNGDVKLALAAYNAGSRYVRKYGGIPPFKATRLYIKKVLKYHREYQAEPEASQRSNLTMG